MALESPLILFMKGDKKPRMPLDKDPLPGEQLALISRWIDQLPERTAGRAAKSGSGRGDGREALSLGARESPGARSAHRRGVTEVCEPTRCEC